MCKFFYRCICVLFIVPVVLLDVDEFCIALFSFDFFEYDVMGAKGHQSPLGGKKWPSGEGDSWAYPLSAESLPWKEEG